MAIIKYNNVSYDTILRDLNQFLASLPEDERWKDFLDSGPGQTLIQLMAGVGAYLSWHSLAARRETDLDRSRLYNSKLSIATVLGYSANRVSAPKLMLTLETDEQRDWEKTDEFGSYKNRNLSLLVSQTIGSGSGIQQVQVDVYVGDWVTVIQNVTNTVDFFIFLVQDEGIDSRIARLTLKVNGVQVTLVETAEDLVGVDKALIRTVPGGVVILFGDGKAFGKKVKAGDEISFEYLKSTGTLDVASPPASSVQVGQGTVKSVNVELSGSGRDTAAKLTALLPGYHAALRRMVTLADHIAVFLAWEGDIISANAKKESDTGECCTILMVYILKDENTGLLRRATPGEKISMLEYLDDHKVLGEQILIQDPREVVLTVNMTVLIEKSENHSAVRSAIIDIFTGLTLKLGATFHMGEVTAEVAALSAVKRVYLESPASDSTLEYDQYFRLGDLALLITEDPDEVVEFEPSNSGYGA